MGFPSTGAANVEQALARWRESHPLGTGPLIGLNIGKQKETPVDDAARDYVASMRRLSPYADYVTVNVSSPNTPELRKLQEPERLRALFEKLQEARTREVPLLVKLSPDLAAQDLDDIVRVVEAGGISGIIATNTTLSREGLSQSTDEVGGLSGPPLHARSVAMVRALKERVTPELLIVGVGGIRSAEHARDFLEAGAALVQVYTGLVYEGPTLVRRILTDL
jgi:dihydroorotate dehydrogenase